MVGQEQGERWTQGTNSFVATPDFASGMCRYLAKQCLDSQEQGRDYIRGKLRSSLLQILKNTSKNKKTKKVVKNKKVIKSKKK